MPNQQTYLYLMLMAHLKTQYLNGAIKIETDATQTRSHRCSFAFYMSQTVVSLSFYVDSVCEIVFAIQSEISNDSGAL